MENELINFFENHLGEIIAIIFALLGFIYGYKADRRAQTSATYVNIDSALKDVLAEGKSHPRFREQKAIATLLDKQDTEEYTQYNIYAEMCMNMVETIYDDALEYPSNRRTYAPTAIWEIILHGDWFEQNQLKFKKPFRYFVKEIKKDLDNMQIDEIYEIIEKNPEKYIDKELDPKKTIRY